VNDCENTATRYHKIEEVVALAWRALIPDYNAATVFAAHCFCAIPCTDAAFCGMGSGRDPENIPHRDKSCLFVPDVLPVVTQTTASGKSNFLREDCQFRQRNFRRRSCARRATAMMRCNPEVHTHPRASCSITEYRVFTASTKTTQPYDRPCKTAFDL